jgi:hypothetical protein
MAEPGGDDMDRDACEQQGRGMDVAQVVQPGMGQRIAGPLAGCGSEWYSPQHQPGTEGAADPPAERPVSPTTRRVLNRAPLVHHLADQAGLTRGASGVVPIQRPTSRRR